jgi:GT2 family glycosyltransferase
MPASVGAGWAGALWIGAVREDDLTPGAKILLDEGQGFHRARLLVRRGGHPLGFVEVAVADSHVAADDVLAAAARFSERPPERPLGSVAPLGPISVVLCTRDRPEYLSAALSSLLLVDHPDFEIIVVDNNPASGMTKRVTDEFSGPRVRVVDAHLPGLARARNVGVRSARHDIVAFTDDDVLLDADWLKGSAAGFAAGDQVGCVTGMAASGEISSLAQWYFDHRVSWARNCSRAVFSTHSPPMNDPLFPFRVGSYGTGANFAVRGSLLKSLGGFDEGLGTGSPAGGGEDIDVFVRVLLAGYELRYQPEALAWHRHRNDLASLEEQLKAYGRGLGAWLTKLAIHRTTSRQVFTRALGGLRHIRSINDIDLMSDEARVLRQISSVETRAILSGPLALARARLAGARAQPFDRERA